MTRMVRMFAEEVREGDRIESPSGQCDCREARR